MPDLVKTQSDHRRRLPPACDRNHQTQPAWAPITYRLFTAPFRSKQNTFYTGSDRIFESSLVGARDAIVAIVMDALVTAHPTIAIAIGVSIALVMGIAIYERRRGRPFDGSPYREISQRKAAPHLPYHAISRAATDTNGTTPIANMLSITCKNACSAEILE